MAVEPDSGEDNNMFRPPLARGMQVLDRSVFQKTVLLKAARVFENKNISKVRTQLERSKDALQQDRLANVHSDPDSESAKLGKKCILLRPEVRQQGAHPGVVTNREANGHDDISKPWPHSSTVKELVDQNLISLITYPLHLGYDYWTYHEIITSILPLNALSDIPSGFSQVGHVVHMNLREVYLPYKTLIASILLDKASGARTIINKIDDVGGESEFRTFKYEVLAGEDDLEVLVSESGCEFQFNYGKVYWNPRLSTEHARLIDMFKEGEAVCDVMAGVGPFAVPAGKKRVFVWANDLNPYSWTDLARAAERNKVSDFVCPYNLDGRTFIRDAAAWLAAEHKVAEIKKKESRAEAAAKGRDKQQGVVVKRLEQPKTFQHYVLNLPASALTFLPSFIGLYPPVLRKKLPPNTAMPIIHVYCFSTKDELEGDKPTNGEMTATDQDSTAGSAEEKIVAEISMQLDYPMRAGKIDDDCPGAVDIWDVRDVAPKKRMFCASFRLPEEVAFRERN